MNEDAAAASTSSQQDTHYRLYMGTAVGGVSICHLPVPPLAQGTPAPLPLPVALHGCAAGANRAVQRMAEGRIGNVWVMALARKDGTVDIITPRALEEEAGVDAQEAQQQSPTVHQADCLFTLKEERMRVGVERWVGLALSEAGLYTCTSSGFFRFTPLALQTKAGQEHQLEHEIHATGEPTLLEFAAPLHSLVFHPPSEPKWFAYGGEEVDLSLWDLQRALSKAPQQGEEAEPSPPATAAAEQQQQGNSKERKRKRQAEARAKARELHWGELWRAKSLPNDALSLPQRPGVTAIAILAESGVDAEAREPAFTIATGTRGGLVRFYNTATARKATREIKVVAEGAVKLCTASRFEDGKAAELFVTDTSGKLYAMDLHECKINYSYADITGAVSAIMPLAAPQPAQGSSRKSSAKPLLVSAALDQQVRLHSTAPLSGVPAQGAQRGGTSKKRGATLYSVFAGAAPTALLWDGLVPFAAAAAETSGGGGADGSDDDDDDEDLFDNMGVVGEQGSGDIEPDSEEEAQEAPKKRRSA